MHTKALEALHVAAEAIRNMPGILSATADNDNDSGEMFFVVDDGTKEGIEYTLTLDSCK